jgi:sugar phosphate isomerase/epimerase
LPEANISMMATYEQYESDLDSVIRDAHTLGAAYCVNAWIPHQGPFTIDLCRRAAANYNQWGKQLKAAGLTFCHHNHDYEFQPYQGKPLYDTMIGETEPEYVHFEMDVFWVVAGGHSPVAYMRRYPSRFRLLHLKDMHKGAPVHDYKVTIPVEWDVPIGTGRVDMRGILREGERIKIKNYFVEDESREAPQNIIKSLHYLKTVRI